MFLIYYGELEIRVRFKKERFVDPDGVLATLKIFTNKKKRENERIKSIRVLNCVCV